MVKIENLCLDMGAFKLNGVNLEIARGACHAIVGPTGSGKTLLLETIIGIQKIKSGRVVIGGKDVTALLPSLRNISYVPQDICLFPHMKVIDNIMYGVKVRKIDPAPLKPFIDELIEFLNISAILERYPAGLSGGEKQRAAIVRALAA
ncbi:MAG TPA: ATP-binding cassette domain-containing protein, partial [Candidatus Wallbacteria bacterium]|nr:ATP-binding cassette domain-containing protein [Candidatus Wallbacteria bacterium]